MSSPVSVEDHGTPHAALMMPLSLYWTFTPGVCAGDNSTLRLDPDNEVQPDGFLFIEPECGGQVKTRRGIHRRRPRVGRRDRRELSQP